jgi:hypothetical protein
MEGGATTQPPRPRTSTFSKIAPFVVLIALSSSGNLK